MRKLINDPFAVVDEMLEGLVGAFPERLSMTGSGRGLLYTRRGPRRRAGIVVGGGSGHEPAFLGYLGHGLADGVAVGNVFAAPAATPAVEVARAIGAEDGVLFLYGNYEGDVMNFDMATELLADEGIRATTVLITDDVASGPPERPEERRGVAGSALVFKAAGARAEEGAGLDEVATAARLANERTRTVGVALGPCTVPAAGEPTFELDEGEMDLGMGVHGEAGMERLGLPGGDEVADRLLELLIADRPPCDGEPLAVLVNLLGSTPLMEGFILLRRVLDRLRAEGVAVHRALVGEYLTSLEMTGASLTVMHLDDELRRLIDAPCAPLVGPAW